MEETEYILSNHCCKSHDMCRPLVLHLTSKVERYDESKIPFALSSVVNVASPTSLL